MEDYLLKNFDALTSHVIRIDAPEHPYLLGIKNQWIIIEHGSEFHVLLETTKMRTAHRAHAGSFSSLSKALEFTYQLKKIFDNKHKIPSL